MAHHKARVTSRKFNLRLPDDLQIELIREAQLNGRSLNQEIVQRLKQSLERYRR